MEHVPRGTLGVSLCCKCGLRPKLTSHLYCKNCKALANAQYYQHRLTKAERKGFLLGAQAMKDAITEMFNRMGDRGMNGFAAAQLVDARLQPDQLGVARLP